MPFFILTKSLFSTEGALRTQRKIEFTYAFHCVSKNVTPRRMLQNLFFNLSNYRYRYIGCLEPFFYHFRTTLKLGAFCDLNVRLIFNTLRPIAKEIAEISMRDHFKTIGRTYHRPSGSKWPSLKQNEKWDYDWFLRLHVDTDSLEDGAVDMLCNLECASPMYGKYQPWMISIALFWKCQGSLLFLLGGETSLCKTPHFQWIYGKLNQIYEKLGSDSFEVPQTQPNPRTVQ